MDPTPSWLGPRAGGGQGHHGQAGRGAWRLGNLHEQGRHWQRPSQPARLGAWALSGRPARPPGPPLLCRDSYSPSPGPAALTVRIRVPPCARDAKSTLWACLSRGLRRGVDGAEKPCSVRTVPAGDILGGPTARELQRWSGRPREGTPRAALGPAGCHGAELGVRQETRSRGRPSSPPAASTDGPTDSPRRPHLSAVTVPWRRAHVTLCQVSGTHSAWEQRCTLARWGGARGGQACADTPQVTHTTHARTSAPHTCMHSHTWAGVHGN